MKDDYRTIDRIGVRILSLLQEDARISNSKIAREVGLAPSAVLERIRRMREDGLIRSHTTILDRKALGFPITAFVEVRTSASLRGEAVVEGLAAIERVVELHDVAGDACYLLKVIAQDIDDLHRTIHHEIGKVEGVVSTSTSISLKTFKETVAVPIGRSSQGEQA